MNSDAKLLQLQEICKQVHEELSRPNVTVEHKAYVQLINTYKYVYQAEVAYYAYLQGVTQLRESN